MIPTQVGFQMSIRDILNLLHDYYYVLNAEVHIIEIVNWSSKLQRILGQEIVFSNGSGIEKLVTGVASFKNSSGTHPSACNTDPRTVNLYPSDMQNWCAGGEGG